MPPEKHMIYYNLLDWLKQPGCPFCTAEARAAGHHLDMILQEGVAHPELREALRKTHGYCRRHAAYWLAAGHPLDRALLYHDQVKNFADFLSLEKPPKHARQALKLAKAWQKHKPCPACTAESEAASRCLDVFLEQWMQPELQAAFQNGPAFCPDHFWQALHRAPDPAIRRTLLDFERKKLRGLQSDLETFLNKLSLQLKAPAFGPEGDSWLRAINLMAGLPHQAPDAVPADSASAKPTPRPKKPGIHSIRKFKST